MCTHPFRATLRGILIMLVTVLCGTAGAQTGQAEHPAVGFRTLNIEYTLPDGGVRHVTAAMWYPSSGTPAYHRYAYVWGRVVPDGPLAPGAWPLVLHSHGVYECGVASAYLHESIAAAGYIVVAPDHEDAANCLSGGGSTWGKPYPWRDELSNLFPNRPLDLQAALLHVLQWFPITSVVLTGHSTGAWTAAVAAADLGPQAMLLWSVPPRATTPLRSVSAPVLLIFGDQEWFAHTWWRYVAWGNTTGPKFQSYIPEAGHYAFTDKQCRPYMTIGNCLLRDATARRITALNRAFLQAWVQWVNPE
jgi:dienelactone hydrolase